MEKGREHLKKGEEAFSIADVFSIADAPFPFDWVASTLFQHREIQMDTERDRETQRNKSYILTRCGAVKSSASYHIFLNTGKYLDFHKSCLNGNFVLLGNLLFRVIKLSTLMGILKEHKML